MSKINTSFLTNTTLLQVICRNNDNIHSGAFIHDDHTIRLLSAAQKHVWTAPHVADGASSACLDCVVPWLIHCRSEVHRFTLLWYINARVGVDDRGEMKIPTAQVCAGLVEYILQTIDARRRMESCLGDGMMDGVKRLSASTHRKVARWVS